MRPPMTTRKKTILLLVAIFLILAILRESGIIDFNYYRSHSSSTSHYNWSDRSVTVTIDSSSMKTKFNNYLYSNLPIIVLSGSDTIYKDENIDLSHQVVNTHPPVVITLIKFNPGFLWMPLYKSTSFSAVGSVDFHDELTKTTPAKIHLLKPGISGRLTISGHTSIKGVCSHRYAVSLIKDVIAKNFATETKRYFSTLDQQSQALNK